MKRDKDIIALIEPGNGFIPIAKSHEEIRSTAISHCLKCGRKPAAALASAAGPSRHV